MNLPLPRLDTDARLEPYARAMVLLAFALMSIGVLMVYSASATKAGVEFGDPTKFLVRQIVWAAAGIGIVFVTMRADPARLERFATPLLVLVVALLATVLVGGPLVNGARRWLRFGPFSFQPSEAAKLVLILWLASHLTRRRHELSHWKRGILPPIVVLAVVLGLVMREPDLGTTLFLAALGAALLLVGGVPIRKLMLAALPAVPLMAVHVISRWSVVRRRFAVLFDPAAGGSAVYQVEQALVAFGAGGLGGRGIGAGGQKLFFLPEAQTDFILPVLGEELGFIGTALVVCLFAAFVACGLRVALGAASRDRFSCLVVFGLVFHVGLQAAGNIAVVTGSVPTKGIALPFISVGGSSLVVLCASVGLLYAFARSLDAGRCADLSPERDSGSLAGGVA